MGAPINTPWILCGNFNNGLNTENRIRQPVTAREIQGFQEMINNLQLTPLRSTGWYFTWCNKQPVASRVYSKIDWALGNFQWLKQYRHIEADFLNPGVSDHSPILLRFFQERRLHPKPFKLFSNVMEHPEFHAILSRNLFDKENEILVEIDKWGSIEDQALTQKSRANWIMYGDTNSKYFHAQLNIRHSKNTITSIYIDTGIKLTDPMHVEAEFIAFFKR
ncbi:uncharacterized protein LOC142165228 [Nicotiana tabacum]|uniref:Uncharacterized protein LOC142165228 n=1 Tax=Nicotiana tabacum TaxID=4097 RepID=A0AC58S4M0_TOBAC